MSKVKHVSFAEFAGNLAELLDTVRAEGASLVVEYASGENVLIKPYATPRRASSNAQSKGARKSTAQSTRQPLPNQSTDPTNISSVGAVYDLDPGSITPG
jgi:hypothetical protein